MKLLIQLKQIQVDKNLTNQEMADLLGVHMITWTNVKNGKYPLSDSLKQKAIRTFPELIPLFLSENASIVSKEGAE